MVKCVQLVGRLRDRATALFGGKIRIVVATASIIDQYPTLAKGPVCRPPLCTTAPLQPPQLGTGLRPWTEVGTRHQLGADTLRQVVTIHRQRVGAGHRAIRQVIC